MHKIHNHVARNALVIPLWQLDTFIAISSSVVIPNNRLNPFAPYCNVQEWSLRK
jgi:hypothetical protein